MKTTINKLRTELQLLAEANEMLNGFYWKDLLRAQSESVCQYPLMTVHYTIGGIVKNQTRVILEINICDRIGKDWNENLNDVESDTLNLQRQIFNAMQSVRWKKLGRIESASCRKFIADSVDYVAGHTMTLTFLLRDTDGVCDLPIFNYDFDSIQTDENTVTVFNSDSSYSVVVDCGGSLELPDITYEIKNTLGDVISSAAVPSVNNISDVLPDVVNTDSDGTPVATPAGVAFVCTPNPPCANGTVNVNKSDGALISAVPVASGGFAPYNVADSVITLNDSASTLISTTNVKATDPAIITAPNGTATNTDASTVIQVKSNGNSTIPNSQVNVNGVNEGNVVSAKTIEIVTTQAGAPYAPTTITVLANTITFDFPACPASGNTYYSAETLKTNATVTYLDGDDGQLQEGRNTDFMTLPVDLTTLTGSSNPALVGVTNRFTDVVFTQVYASPVTLDWTTYNGLGCWGFQTNLFFVTGTLEDLILAVRADTTLTYTDWELPNINQLFNLCSHNHTSIRVNYSPFNAGANIYSNTFRENDATRIAILSVYSSTSSLIIFTTINTSVGRNTLPTRFFTNAELGL